MKWVFLFVLLTLLRFYSPAQVYVSDKRTRWQVEREVFVRWNKFRPRMLFWIVFRKYKKSGDKRNIKQYLPTMIALELNKRKAEDQKDDTSDMAGYKLAQQANIEAEKHYHLHFRPIFEKYTIRYNDLRDKLNAENANRTDIQAFLDEKLMLDSFLKVVREGNTEPGESNEAMTQIQKGYEELLAVMYSTWKLYKTKNKFTTITIE